MSIKAEDLNVSAFCEQELDEEEKELLHEVYRRFDVFEQACRPYHDVAREARAILRLQDPRQDPPNTPESERTLQLQTLKSTFNNCVAEQVQNMPKARIVPERPENQAVSDDLQDIVRYVMDDVNDYEQIHRRRAEDLYAVGTAITQVVWDETLNHGKGDVALIRWALESFLWDTTSENIQDSRAVIKVSWHPLSWYRQHYPEKAQYIHADNETMRSVGLPDSQGLLDGRDENRAALLEYWYRRFDAKRKRYTINVAYVAGGALLGNYTDVYTHGMYPFVLDVHSTIEGSAVGEGMVMELVPMMRYINRYAKYVDTNLRFASKGRLLTRKNSGIDRHALANWDNDIIEGNSVEQGVDWSWLQHAPLPSTATNMMLQFQSDLKMDSGMNQYSRGETSGGVVSGKAISALQEAGGKISSLRKDTLNCGFKEIVKQMLWLMSQFYDDTRVFLITGHDNPRSIQFSSERFFGTKTKGAISPPPYMVQVDVDQRSPVRIEAMNQMFMEAYTMAAQAKQNFPLSALFRMMNIDGKDRLLPVIEENEHQLQMMQELQTQNEQMQQQMQQLAKENDTLRRTTVQMSNSLANVNATENGGYAPREDGMPQKEATEGGGGDTRAAFIEQARSSLAGL